MVFKIVKKRLYQEHVFNNDDSNSYFVKNQVLEPDMKSANLDSLVNYKTRKLQNAQITKRANIDNFKIQRKSTVP